MTLFRRQPAVRAFFYGELHINLPLRGKKNDPPTLCEFQHQPPNQAANMKIHPQRVKTIIPLLHGQEHFRRTLDAL